MVRPPHQGAPKSPGSTLGHSAQALSCLNFSGGHGTFTRLPDRSERALPEACGMQHLGEGCLGNARHAMGWRGFRMPAGWGTACRAGCKLPGGGEGMCFRVRRGGLQCAADLMRRFTFVYAVDCDLGAYWCRQCERYGT